MTKKRSYVCNRKNISNLFSYDLKRNLLACLRRRQPGTMAGVNLMRLAQALAAMGVQKVHTHYGNRWRVVEV